MKGENITIEEARELVSNRLLWPLVRDFLWDFAPSIHASWMEGLQASDIPSQDASPRIKRFILDSLHVEPCFHTFPADDGSRIMLLDGATLESIIKWLGALACAESLRRVTSGEVVRRLKAALPGIYPEVFGYTAYFKDLAARGDVGSRSEDIVAEVVGAGYGFMFSVFSKLPASVVARAKFKIPRDFLVSCPPREIALTVVLKLLTLKFPEAYKLCCS